MTNDSATLLHQRLNESTKKAFTINFEFYFISNEIKKFDETFVTICKQRSIDVRVKLMIKNKIFKRQTIEFKILYNANNN